MAGRTEDLPGFRRPFSIRTPPRDSRLLRIMSRLRRGLELTQPDEQSVLDLVPNFTKLFELLVGRATEIDQILKRSVAALRGEGIDSRWNCTWACSLSTTPARMSALCS